MTVTFVVSDGTGLTDATSYVSLDAFKTYWFDQAYNYGDLTDNDIKRLLNKSSRYIDSTYRSSFTGYRETTTQSMEWPRTSATYIDGEDIDESTIPTEITQAVCEAAYLMFSGEDLTAIISKVGKITKYSVEVDVISEATTYESGSSFYSDIYTIINNALSRLTGGNSGRFRIKAVRVGGESS